MLWTIKYDKEQTQSSIRNDQQYLKLGGVVDELKFYNKLVSDMNF